MLLLEYNSYVHVYIDIYFNYIKCKRVSMTLITSLYVDLRILNEKHISQSQLWTIAL